MEIKFANNASTLLLDNIDANTTTINVLPDTGALFPELRNPSDYFKITLVNPGDGSYEIMHVVSTVGDQFTVERGKENTDAKPFPQNSIVENRLTAGSIEHVLNDVAASSTTAGRIRIATEAEVRAGIVDDAAMVPAYSTSLYVPVGLIAPYSGQFDANGFVIDAATSKTRLDWHICDGNEGTPDLRSRFVRAVGSDAPINTTGGSANLNGLLTVQDTTLTIAQMPQHFHDTMLWNGDGGGSGTQAFDSTSSPWSRTAYRSEMQGGGTAHTHGITSEENSNMPPYYALYYIMKIS